MSIKWKFILFGIIIYLILGTLIFTFREDNIWLFVTGEVFLIGSMFFYRRLYVQLVKPVDTISSGANLLKSRDFNTRLTTVGQKEIDILIDVFNKMSDQLHEERIQQEEKNLFLNKVIEASPSGILIFGADNSILQLNPAAKKIFGSTQKKDFVLSDLPKSWNSALSEILPGASQVLKIDGIRRFKLVCNTFIDKGFHRKFIIVEELTNELIKTERSSYEKVIRMMSHEVNNSVGAVNSVMQTVLGNTAAFDESIKTDLEETLNIAIERNNNLNSFMHNFAGVVKLPQPELKAFDVIPVVKRCIAFYQQLPATKGLDFRIILPESVIMNGDELQLEQVFLNIIKNSIEAIQTDGYIKVTMEEESIIFEDNGCGISVEVAEKLFTPFYSTKKQGQGIGLTLIREILHNHGFEFRLWSEEGKTRFRITP